MTDFGRRAGDMLKSTYDADADGIVDEAEALSAGAQADANKIQGVTVDDTDKGDAKVLAYNATSQNLEYEDQSGGGPADAIRGDGTANRYLRVCSLTIDDGTNANTLKCTLANKWNGDAIAVTDNIPRNGSAGHFTLNVNGDTLTIAAAALSGNCVAVVSASVRAALCVTNIYVAGTHISNNITVKPYNQADGALLDLTDLVDIGLIYIHLAYITDG